MLARRIFLSILLFLSFFIGCSQKKENTQEEFEHSSVELTLPQIPKLAGPYKPTNKDIQIALKNAGFYQGEIDGDIGPLTKEAIRQFQAKNDLAIDGKIGLKTWDVLSKYLQDTDKQEPRGP